MVAASCLIQPNFDFQKTPMPLWADGGIVFGSGRSPHRDPLADLAHMGSRQKTGTSALDPVLPKQNIYLVIPAKGRPELALKAESGPIATWPGRLLSRVEREWLPRAKSGRALRLSPKALSSASAHKRKRLRWQIGWIQHHARPRTGPHCRGRPRAEAHHRPAPDGGFTSDQGTVLELRLRELSRSVRAQWRPPDRLPQRFRHA